MFTISNRIEYLDHVFEGQAIKRGNPYYARSLTSSSLEIDSFDFEVLSSDTTLTKFVRNTPLTYYHDDVQMGIFYVQKISRTSINTYRFECTSTIGLLDESYHNGGIYTGEAVKEVVEDICGPFPVWIKTNIHNIQLYGWLPIATRRENLSQVLFAIGATLKVDYNGTLRVEGLWDGQSTEIDAGHMHAGGSIEYSTPVTQVIVTEHAYTANATEMAELFNGTTTAGDKITFDEPCYDLVADGFSIIESAANYAIVSAGSGALTGKKYVHTTRQIVKDVQPAARELVSQSDNIVTVENATLVSLVNANAVADRLVRYYACTERIVNKMVTQRESPGDVVSVYHPYEDAAVQGCIESSDVTVSGKLASAESILVGYTPSDIGEQEYYDTVEVISQSGSFTVPEHTTSIRAVLIGGGSGGTNGNPGEPGKVRQMLVTDIVTPGGDGGAGGEPGTPGNGGKINVVEMDVSSGQQMQISVGQGGTTDQDGSATTLSFNSNIYSSDDGSINPDGYIDVISGTVYARTGESGVPGGAGGTGGVCRYGKSEDGEDVGNNSGGSGKDAINGWQHFGVIRVGSGGGGGAAFGADGEDGKIGYAEEYGDSNNPLSGGYSGKPGTGGKGATPVKPATPAIYGTGGTAGHGGGGAGGTGAIAYEVDYENGEKYPKDGYSLGDAAEGGAGGTGGDGAPGCVLIYYRVYAASNAGRFLTSDGLGFNELHNRMVVV